MKRLLLLLCCLPMAALAQKGLPKPGTFSATGALYFIAKGNHVEGYYQAYRGDGQFSTIFFIKGTQVVGKKEYALTTFFPADTDPIKGTLTIADKDNLTITLAETPPGSEFGKEGDKNIDAFERSGTSPWLHLGYVNKPRTRLLNAADSTASGKAYIVQYDCVALLERKKGYVKVEYIGQAPEQNRDAWLPVGDVTWLYKD